MSVDRRALFARSMGPQLAVAIPEAEVGQKLRDYESRVRELETQEPLHGVDLRSLLVEHGIGRRAFLRWVSAMTALLTLPPLFEPLIARATEVANRIPVIWIEGQSCRGNSEALLRSEAPTVDELLFDTISLEFHQLLMVAAGFQAEQRKADAVKANYGKYLLVVEGSIPTGYSGAFSTSGASGQTFMEELTELSKGAAAVMAVGSCATYAALPAADPNPTGAISVQDVVSNVPVVNLPACPINAVNFVGTLLHFILAGSWPALDTELRPLWAFAAPIHDNCPRRAHFDAGEFVLDWGDQGAQNNFCLYKMGCKGPMTHNNCSLVLYNGGTNWPIGAGHGCIGCSEADFWDRYAYERPLATANVNAPGLFGWGVENSVDKFGLGLLTLTAVGIAAHAVGSGVVHHRQRTAHAAADRARKPQQPPQPPQSQQSQQPPDEPAVDPGERS